MDPARARSLTHSLTPTDRDRDSPHSRDRPTDPAGRAASTLSGMWAAYSTRLTVSKRLRR